MKDYKCCLPVEEIDSFMTLAKSIRGQNDVCRDALVCLMAGSEFQSPYQHELFDFLLEGEIDNWIWFHLKLASFRFTDRNQSLLGIQQQLPLNYKPYFMEDLVVRVTEKMTKEQFIDPNLSEIQNSANYARILFLIGEYQLALKELLSA